MPDLQVIKLVNEVYHMYNRHQYPFVALNINVASGKQIAEAISETHSRFSALHEHFFFFALFQNSWT